MRQQLWTDQQFEQMSWHDNYVHALRVVEGSNGLGELVLDIDYILEWVNGTEGFQFKVTPATLAFRDVSGLRIALDYATPTAGIGPFSIHAIERSREPREHYVAQSWKIVINWPVGEITFEASGFVQRSHGRVIFSNAQGLRPEERVQNA